jgi:eukaryotic-like serine/threonine-protein kinase
MGLAENLLADRYRLDEPIGAGGFSEVWRATDTVLARPVAVKLLHPGYARQPEALARFRAEARHAAALSHQNIAHIYDYDDSADGPQAFLVMELVDGPCRSLKNLPKYRAVDGRPQNSLLGAGGPLAPVAAAAMEQLFLGDLFPGIIGFGRFTASDVPLR